MRYLKAVCALWILLIIRPPAVAQEVFSNLPGHERYQQILKSLGPLTAAGRVSNVTWSSDGATLTFQTRDQWQQVDLTSLTMAPWSPPEGEPSPGASGRQRRARTGRPPVPRAEQSPRVPSPDGKRIAIYRDFNVTIEPFRDPADRDPADDTMSAGEADSDQAPNDATRPRDSNQPVDEIIQVTTSGSEYFRYGTACWVYGEELDQDSAMWWSPDGTKLAFYEIDERHLQDYYLTTDNVELYTDLQVVRYPKAGMDNPIAGLLIFDLASRQTLRVDVGGDRQQYVYDVRFTPCGTHLLFNRTNRRQDRLEVMAADVTTGQTRLVVTENQPTWQENRPLLRFLEDGQRFIWETERTGWRQFELRQLDGSLLHPLSPVEPYPVEAIVQLDEPAGLLYYSAYSDSNPLNAHLHRVRLDGTQPSRLTGKPLHHSAFHIAPDNRWFIATYEAIDTPPVTALFNDRGEEVLELARGTSEQAEALGLVAPELFSFTAADGHTQLQGVLHKPAGFDPSRKYPLVISVYGGPGSRGLSNRYDPAKPHCEFGFLIATVANRGTTGRGKAFESATYMKLGTVDIQDQADGVRWLSQRPYVDASRVGIFGHSYGGYMSALALLRYPDLFHVGVAGAPVTDWKNYDTIYTERYMRTPDENLDGYRDGSCLTYVSQLKGRLLLLHGLVDDNVHPSNTWQLADALQRENLRFDMMIYPRNKHGLTSNATELRWEYLHRHLRPEPLPPQ